MCSRCKSASSARNRIAALSATLYLGQALVGGIVSVPAAGKGIGEMECRDNERSTNSQAQAAEAEGEKKDEGTTVDLSHTPTTSPMTSVPAQCAAWTW